MSYYGYCPICKNIFDLNNEDMLRVAIYYNYDNCLIKGCKSKQYVGKNLIESRVMLINDNLVPIIEYVNSISEYVGSRFLGYSYNTETKRFEIKLSLSNKFQEVNEKYIKEIFFSNRLNTLVFTSSSVNLVGISPNLEILPEESNEADTVFKIWYGSVESETIGSILMSIFLTGNQKMMNNKVFIK